MCVPQLQSYLTFTSIEMKGSPASSAQEARKEGSDAVSSSVSQLAACGFAFMPIPATTSS